LATCISGCQRVFHSMTCDVQHLSRVRRLGKACSAPSVLNCSGASGATRNCARLCVIACERDCVHEGKPLLMHQPYELGGVSSFKPYRACACMVAFEESGPGVCPLPHRPTSPFPLSLTKLSSPPLVEALAAQEHALPIPFPPVEQTPICGVVGAMHAPSPPPQPLPPPNACSTSCC